MKTAKLIAALGCFLASVAIIATVIDTACFNRSFYENEYLKNDTTSYTGMSAQDNLNATDTLLDYLRDERSDIICTAEVNGTKREVFNERETAHMVDVKALYQNAVLVRNICAVCAVLLIAAACFMQKHAIPSVLKDGWLNGIALSGLVIAFIAVWAIADFNAFWTSFHQLFFTNDLWLLDPRTSIMINLFPSSFFFDLVIRIIVWTVLIHAAITAAVLLWEKRAV